MADRSLRLGKAVKDRTVCPEAPEGHAAAVVGGKLTVREAGAGAAAGLNIVTATGEYSRPACAVVRGVLQEEDCSGKGLSVLILFLHFQRSRPAEVVTLLGDRHAVLGD